MPGIPQDPQMKMIMLGAKLADELEGADEFTANCAIDIARTILAHKNQMRFREMTMAQQQTATGNPVQ